MIRGGAMPEKRCWLVKTEPDDYSIDDLKRDGKTCWDGVRNYQARNTLRDEMKVGDPVLFYHSSCEPMGVAGVGRVCRAGYPDHTALERGGKHFDPKATRENPIWMMVDIEFVEKFAGVVPLAALKANAGLKGMALLRPGQRLSVQPVTAAEFEIVRHLGRAARGDG